MAIVDEMPETPLHRQLAALRARVGLSQRDLAARMATTQSAVCALEVGRVSPTLTTLTRWAAALGAEIVLRAELTQAEVNAFMAAFQRPDPATPLDLDAIRARADAATPGPWSADETGTVCADADLEPDGAGGEILPTDGPMEVAECYRSEQPDERAKNARFIAATRTDIPALLAALAESQAAENRYRQLYAVGVEYRRQQPVDPEASVAWETFHAMYRKVEAERDEAREDAERMRPVVEAARAMIRTPSELGWGPRHLRETRLLVEAVHAYEGESDTYETQTGGSG